MIQALQLILALCFIVLTHELGHFAFARLFKVRVEKFYLFFNPWFTLFRAKKINGQWRFKFFTKNGEEDEWAQHPETTEWGLGWLPLGGYCAIAGMVDETHSSEDLGSEPQEWEFRSKPAWQRMLIILGGILVNFIEGIIIFICLVWHFGTDTLPLRNADKGLYYSQMMLDEGFQQHDKIIAINGEEPQVLGDIINALVVEGKRDVVVLRGTDTVQLQVSEDFGNRYLAKMNDFDRIEREKHRADKNYQKQSYILVEEWIPFVLDSIVPEHAAYYGGLEKGDSIVAVGGQETPSAYQVKQALRMWVCDSVRIDYFRAGDLHTTTLFIGDQGQMGVIIRSKYQYFPIEHTDYTFFEAVPAGIRNGWQVIASYVKQFRLIFSKEGAQSMGGFIAIGNIFPNMWSWYAFWHITAFLSLVLAFMNFLPIPALDGGYILFLLVEMITRRKPSDKFLEIANQIGFWLLLALLLFANGNDLLKLFF